jgi:hypothetical protein
MTGTRTVPCTVRRTASIGFAWGVSVYWIDLVTSGPAPRVDLIDDDFGAEVMQIRSTACERAGQMINPPDFDRCVLRVCWGGDR